MISSERLVLDTSAYSHFRTGQSGVLDLLAGAAVVVVPAVVLGELQAGFVLGKRVEENRRMLAEFLDEPFVSILDVTAATGRHYGKIFAALRLAGVSLPSGRVAIEMNSRPRKCMCGVTSVKLIPEGALLHYSPTMRGCLATPNFGQISALESVPIGGVRAQSVG